MKIKLTVLAFFISMLLTGQAFAFDVGGFSYSITSGTTAEVTGRASGNTARVIVIPDTVVDSGTTYSVTTIATSSFRSIYLTSLTIGNSVTTIGDYAFDGNDLTSLTIGNSVTTIGDYAFQDNALSSVIIPDSVTSIGVEAFEACNLLTSVIIGNSVTTIGHRAFRGTALTSVIIPDSVTTIGGYAFYGNALTSVIIPDSVTTIGDHAFHNNALTSAAFEGDFGTFNLDMFLYNPTLATITYCVGTASWPQGFNNGSTNIVTTPITCLSDVDGLSYSAINATDVEVTGRVSGNTATAIVIPDTIVDSGTTYSVTTIGEGAFSGNALTSVTIGNSVTTIGQNAFAFNAFTSVIIPDSVTTIGDGAFADTALTSVIIPDSVTTIGASAFSTNTLLTSVTIGNSVTTIGDGAFAFNALASVIIPDSVTTIGDYAFQDNALTSVIIPDSVTSIGVEAFEACSLLTSVIIGNSVTTIGHRAFRGTALTSVIIPDSVTTIGASAFNNNVLTSAAFEGDFGTFNLDMFGDNPTLATITYCVGTASWPQGFNNGSTIIVTTPIGCSPPDAPTIDSIAPVNPHVSITVTPGADNGSPITGYTAYCFGDTFYFGASPTSPITVSGLTNGVNYACAVSAKNARGTSPLSAVSAPFVALPAGC